MKKFMSKSCVLILLFAIGSSLAADDFKKDSACTDYLQCPEQEKDTAKKARTQTARDRQTVQVEQGSDRLEHIWNALRTVKKPSRSTFSRVVKFSAMAVGGAFTVGGGIFAYRHDICGFGSLIGSWGSWWQSFRNWLGIRRLESAQKKHHEQLNRHGQQLGRIEEQQKVHSDSLNTHTKQLVRIGFQNEKIRDELSAHTSTLGDHTQKLGSLVASMEAVQSAQEAQKTVVDGYGEQLTNIQSKLENTATKDDVNNLAQSIQKQQDAQQRQNQDLSNRLTGLEGKISSGFSSLRGCPSPMSAALGAGGITAGSFLKNKTPSFLRR